jgi:hypothetical protein
MTDLDDVLRDRLATLKAERDRARAALERAKEQSVSPIQVDPALVERFSRIMKENFTTGSMPFPNRTCSRSSARSRSMTTDS